jgi:hypothetical protein
MVGDWHGERALPLTGARIVCLLSAMRPSGRLGVPAQGMAGALSKARG